MEIAALDEGEPETAEPGIARPETAAPRPSRYERLRTAATARGIPLPAILTFCAVVVVIYLTGKLAYRMLDILLMIAVSGFLGVPFPLLWALWVGIVDFLPMIGGALAGIPTVLFALAHSLTAGLVTAAVFVAYQQLENHVLNPLIMSRTVNVSPLLVLMAVLLGTSLGDWAGGVFGGFVAALISVPCGALFVMRLNGWDRALKVTADGKGPRPARHPPEP